MIRVTRFIEIELIELKILKSKLAEKGQNEWLSTLNEHLIFKAMKKEKTFKFKKRVNYFTKVGLFMILVILVSCQETVEKESVNINYATIINDSASKVSHSSSLKTFLNDSSFEKSAKGSSADEYLIDEVTLHKLLNETDLPEEYKNSLTVENVNHIIKEVLIVHKRGSIKGAFNNLNMTKQTKDAIEQLISDESVQEISDLVNLNSLTEKERGSLEVINDLTNEIYTDNYLSRKSCLVSGPNGSVYMHCGTAFAVVGAVIGGQTGGFGGAVVGAVVGYLVGSLIETIQAS